MPIDWLPFKTNLGGGKNWIWCIFSWWKTSEKLGSVHIAAVCVCVCAGFDTQTISQSICQWNAERLVVAAVVATAAMAAAMMVMGLGKNSVFYIWRQFPNKLKLNWHAVHIIRIISSNSLAYVWQIATAKSLSYFTLSSSWALLVPCVLRSAARHSWHIFFIVCCDTFGVADGFLVVPCSHTGSYI